MHDVHRRVPAGPGQAEQPVDRLRLRHARTADGMPLRLRLALPDAFLPQTGDDPMILAVRGDQYVLPHRPLQDPHQIQVVQPAVIGHVRLEAGDALLPGDLRHVVEHAVVHMLEDPMEAVIHHGVSVREPMILPHLMPRAASLRAERHVIHDRRRTATCCRYGAVVEIVDHPGDAHVQVHVRVDVHRAGQYAASGGVDDLHSGRAQRLLLDALRHICDPAVFYDDMLPVQTAFRDDRSAPNDGFHMRILSSSGGF